MAKKNVVFAGKNNEKKLKPYFSKVIKFIPIKIAKDKKM